MLTVFSLIYIVGWLSLVIPIKKRGHKTSLLILETKFYSVIWVLILPTFLFPHLRSITAPSFALTIHVTCFSHGFLRVLIGPVYTLKELMQEDMTEPEQPDVPEQPEEMADAPVTEEGYAQPEEFEEE